MNELDILKEKIESLRERLNQAAAEDLRSEQTYEISRELDVLIEQYLDIVE